MQGKGLLVVAAIVASLAIASVALAATSTDTTFKMKATDGEVEYSGKVTSHPRRARCIEGRKVKIFHRGILIAETETNKDGEWKVDGPRPPVGDNVTAEVTKKGKRKKACKGTEVTKEFKG
jgi:hypothetical protein